jgi:hypothetical protein
MGEAAGWRVSADCYALVAETAAVRGVNPLLVTAMRADAARFRGYASREDGGDVCVCGHGREAHRHYRRGTDCALCDCPRWRPAVQ